MRACYKKWGKHSICNWSHPNPFNGRCLGRNLAFKWYHSYHDRLWSKNSQSPIFPTRLRAYRSAGFTRYRKQLVHHRYHRNRIDRDWKSIGLPCWNGCRGGNFRGVFWRQAVSIERHHQFGLRHVWWGSFYPHTVHALHHSAQYCHYPIRFFHFGLGFPGHRDSEYLHFE